jgi:hypothetical protein
MGGKVKKALGVAAAVAIPFVAPAVAPLVASSIGLTSMTAASALTGAVLGAANDKLLLGGSGLAGAVSGGIGGGIAGYSAGAGASGLGSAGTVGSDVANTAATTAANTGAYEAGLMNSVLPSVGDVGSSALSGTAWGGVYSPELASALGAAGDTAGTLGATLSGTEAAGALGNTLSSAAPSFYNTTQGGLNVLGSYVPEAAAGASGGSGGILGTVSDAWEGLSNNAQQAILKGVGNITAGTLSGAYDTDPLKAQREYLNQASEMQKEAFRKKMAAAEGLIGQSRYYDPYYYGTQAQNDALIRGTAAKNEALRSMSGTGRTYASDAEARRYNLGTSLNAASQYTQAADAAQNQKVRTIQAGLNAMPNGVPDISASYGGLYNSANQLASNYANTFRDIYGTLYSKSNDEKKEQDAYNTSNSWMS